MGKKNKRKDSNSETFVEITNKDIYDSILEIKEQLNEFIIKNQKEHFDIIKRQDYTNGKVRLNRWIATTALTLVSTLIGLILVFIKMI